VNSRLSKDQVTKLLGQLDAQGFIEREFEDELVRAPVGVANAGYRRAQAIMTTFRNRRPEMRLRTRAFRLDGDTGGMLVVARAEVADSIFTEYGTGFFD